MRRRTSSKERDGFDLMRTLVQHHALGALSHRGIGGLCAASGRRVKSCRSFRAHWQGRRRRHLIRHGVLAHDDDSGKARRRQNSKYRRHLSILSMTVTTEASAGRHVESRQPRHPLGGRVVHLRGRRGLPRRPLATSGRTHPAPRRRVSGVGRRPALTLRWTPNHLRTSACRRRPFSCDARRCIANHYRRRANYLMVCTVCGG